MATREQIEANRRNAKLSTGPKAGTDRTRFNGLKHGLRAEQVVLPGEDPAAFEAERKAWIDDWKPASHTRAVLVERAAVASWKLRRATRVEAARLYDVAADAAHEFDVSQRERIGVALHLLPSAPAEAVARLRSESAGLDRLIGLWDELAAAVEAGSWSRADHHDRLLPLLGHRDGPGAAPPESAAASLVLLAAVEAEVAGAPTPSEVAGAAAALRALCAERSAEYRRERSQYWDPGAYRRHLIDAAVAPTTKEAQLMHRYEVAHEASLRAALRGLLALAKAGADLPEPEPELAAVAEVAPEPAAVAEVAAEAVAAADTPKKCDSNSSQKTSCDKLASVGNPAPSGDHPAGPGGSPGGPARPIGGDPGPPPAPSRR